MDFISVLLIMCVVYSGCGENETIQTGSAKKILEMVFNSNLDNRYDVIAEMDVEELVDLEKMVDEYYKNFEDIVSDECLEIMKDETYKYTVTLNDARSCTGEIKFEQEDGRYVIAYFSCEGN